MRTLLAIVVFVATFYFVYWVPFSILPLGENRTVAFVGSLLCAGAAAVAFWRASGRRPAKDAAGPGPLANVLTGALAVGAVGFVLGFFGPILLTPSSNQGPLLGLFVTGPLGFLLGGIGGYLYWLARGRRER